MMVQRALMRQFDTAKTILREIAAMHMAEDWDRIQEILEDNAWIWEADIRD